jgi:MFS family permease
VSAGTETQHGGRPRAGGGATGGRQETLRRHGLVSLLGLMTILSYGSTYYLLTVLGPEIAADTGWSLPLVVSGLSLGLLVSGIVAPWIGRRIEAHGGRAVLPAGCLATGGGLALLGVADRLWVYALAWIVLGVGMAGTFYDAAFASLGRQYGLRARAMITLLTLFGGFASTICWPLSAALMEALDWRGACFVYAAILATFAVAIRACMPPPPARRLDSSAPSELAAAPSGGQSRRGRLLLLVVLGFIFALSASITAVVSVHLVPLLGARGVGLAAAIAFGALIGPSQVAARVIEYVLGRRFHPLWTLIASTILMALGLGLLALGWSWVALTLVLYASGVGLKSIASGTVPLALIGPEGYATAMGRLAMPSLTMQALAPVGAAELLSTETAGVEALLWALAGAALLNLLLAAVLIVRLRLGKRVAPRASR